MASVFSVGSIECRLILDGLAWPPAAQLFANAPEDEVAGALEGQIDGGGNLQAPYQALLAEVDGRLVLVDGGNGDFPHLFECDAGRLVAELAGEEITPDDVELVIVTHGHTDHTGGLVRDGRPVFAKARHLVARAESDFWVGDEPERSGVPALMSDGARAALQPLYDAGLIDLVDPGAEPIPGVRLLAASGHTPGQLAVELRSGGEALLFLADVLLHPLQAEHPDWCMILEVGEAETVEATRRALLGRASEERLLVAASHLDGVLTVEAAGSGFRLSPA